MGDEFSPDAWLSKFHTETPRALRSKFSPKLGTALRRDTLASVPWETRLRLMVQRGWWLGLVGLLAVGCSDGSDSDDPSGSGGAATGGSSNSGGTSGAATGGGGTPNTGGSATGSTEPLTCWGSE